MNLTNLRKELYKVVDNVIETGLPVDIERNGHVVQLVLVEPKLKLDNLKPHDCINGDPEELIDLQVCDWQPDALL